MKRGPGPQRKTPLSSSSELPRGAGLARGQGLQRSAPMPRSPPEDDGRPKRTGKANPAKPVSASRRAAVYLRDGNRCARCGREVSAGTRQLQHRVPRGMGGRVDHVRFSALILLCGTSATDPDGCHAHVETWRVQAQAAGFLVPAGTAPETWPVHYHDGWFYLHDNGARVPTGPYGASS